MNNVELKKIIDDHQHWINEDCEDWQKLKANLREADLYGANLYGANLRGADLYGANLYGADLYGANLREADLYGADLREANLREADLYGANLRGANLYGANLRGADLYGADLRGADLYGADLDFSCLPLWCGSLEANFDSRQLKQIAYHLVKAGLQSSNATDADREELGKLIEECGEIRR